MSDWSAVYPSRHGPVICPKLDWYIGRSLQLYGEYSQGEVDLLAPLLAPGNIIIDVGANVGALTLPLSAGRPDIHAAEVARRAEDLRKAHA